MVWQTNILNNCYELSEGYEPRTTHQGQSLPLDPAGGLPFPKPPVSPPPNPGYATAYKSMNEQTDIQPIKQIEHI